MTTYQFIPNALFLCLLEEHHRLKQLDNKVIKATPKFSSMGTLGPPLRYLLLRFWTELQTVRQPMKNSWPKSMVSLKKKKKKRWQSYIKFSLEKCQNISELRVKIPNTNTISYLLKHRIKTTNMETIA